MLVLLLCSVVVVGSGDMWGLEESGSALGSGSGAISNSTVLDNITLTCAARSIQGPVVLPYSTILLTTMTVLQSILRIILFFLGISLNSLLVVLIVKFKKLRTVSFAFSLQIIANNLALSVLFYLVAFANVVANRWVFGEHICVAVGLLLFISVLVRTLLMFVFVVDRFLFVFLPFEYPKHHKKVLMVLSIVSWLFALGTCIIPIPQILDCYIFNSYLWVCDLSLDCSSACSVYGVTFFFVVLIPVIVIPTVLYIILYIKARLARKATVIASDGITSNQGDWKATITFSILFSSIFVVTLPTLTVPLIISVFYKTSEEPPALYVVNAFSVLIFSLLPVIDPIVIMRNKDVREVIDELATKMLKKHNKIANSQNMK